MLRNIQVKVILIYTILGMLLIGTLGIFFTYQIEKISSINNQEITQLEYQNKLQEQIQNARITTIGAVTIFGGISIILGIWVSKAFISPITKLMKNVPKIGEGKNKTEVDELADAFGVMRNEIKGNLSEVSKQKNQIETILLHMTDGIIAFDMDGKITHINPAAVEFLHLSERENTFDRIFAKLNIDINLEKTIYLENWTSSEQRVHVGEKYLNILFATFKDENDRPAGVMAMIQDITEHVKLDNMRKEFVADVSHELKTPITSIMGYADTLVEGEYDKETQDKFLGVISSEARRMAKLVSDLLTLSRYDNNKVHYEATEFDLGELVKKCQEKLQLEADKKNQHTECFVTANVPPVIANKDGIERVILNILSNSIKYTQENGNIKIYVGFVYNDAYVKIIDNGIGIPEEDLNRIFERFYRVDKARTRELGGTGLGLSIAKEILNQNKGSIDIKSEPEKGTEVVIRIPTKK